MKAWSWVQDPNETRPTWHLRDGQGRDRVTIWRSYDTTTFTWHTWDERGTGGENSSTPTLDRAKDEAVAALVRQGWAPGGWRVQW